MNSPQVICLVLVSLAALTAANTVPRIGFAPAGRVVGGQQAQPHSAPFIVSLQIGTANVRSHVCGGSLIRNDVVLTAAHCLIGTGATMHVVAGGHNVSVHSSETTQQVRRVQRQVPHELYAGGVGPYDVAVIFVDIPFTLTNQVQLINIPTTDPVISGVATLFGWGSISNTETQVMPQVLMTVTKPVLTDQQCLNALANMNSADIWNQNTLCTGPLTGGISSCSGDSGGPLVQNGQLIGIAAWAVIPCGSANAPAGYMRAPAYRPWIMSQL